MKKLSGLEIVPDSFEDYVYKHAQDKQHELQTGEIDTTMISEGEIKLEEVSGVRKIATMINGVVYKVTVS